MDPFRVGVIGCGAISGAYFTNASKFPILKLVACADLDAGKAQAAAEKYGVERACTVEQLLGDSEVQIVLNLTVPKAHVPVGLAAIDAGKHLFCEKPLGINRWEGMRLVESAATRQLRIGCAPDTVLGSGIQTARKLIDSGAIGRPVAFTAFMMCPGHESWHPSPEFYYETGGGPMFDMGPYYLTALLQLLGPVKRISGAASIAIPDREITSEPKRGKRIRVETPDHVCGTMEFTSGAVGTIITSFATRFPTYDMAQPITIYGTEGTLRVPDPNHFDGNVHLRRNDDADWTLIPPAFHTGCGRAIGLADMAHAIRSGRVHRCNGDQAFAVLDLMQGFLDSTSSGKTHVPVTKYLRPSPVPSDLPFGVLD